MSPQIETSKTEGTKYNWTGSELKLGRMIEELEEEADALRSKLDGSTREWRVCWDDHYHGTIHMGWVESSVAAVRDARAMEGEPLVHNIWLETRIKTKPQRVELSDMPKLAP